MFDRLITRLQIAVLKFRMRSLAHAVIKARMAHLDNPYDVLAKWRVEYTQEEFETAKWQLQAHRRFMEETA